MEISDVRRRLRQTLESAKRAGAEQKVRADAANRAYDGFLSRTATPVFQMFAGALRAEGYLFQVFTPADTLRLMSERSSDDFIELMLDSSNDPPVVMARINRGRGSHLLRSERPVREGAAVEQLSEEDVLGLLLAEIGPFVQR
jgi:hypothetical protein